MLFFYSLGVWLYAFIARIVSPFNFKARAWVQGRRGILGKISAATGGVKGGYWFHFPSLGEFEQGRPVLEAIKRRHPDKRIVITFFSPSGYEVRKNYAGADHIFYLPLDTPANARVFLDIIAPELAIFTKYDYWYYYFRELHRRNIPLFVISAIFRKEQPFFNWYGSLHRELLGFIDTVFVQDENSATLLRGLSERKSDGFNVVVAGDTRFDRVAENAANIKAFPDIAAFIRSSPVVVCGSTWDKDEELLSALPALYPGWKFIIAPHEIGDTRIAAIEVLFKPYGVVRYSSLAGINSPADAQVLIIDNIGILSSLYQYGAIAYIGGGFGAGIHNTLEAASFDLPVIFGPNYRRFKEACDLVQVKAAFSVDDEAALVSAAAGLMDAQRRAEAGKIAGNYVRANTGATQLIVAEIERVMPAPASG